jgi:protein-disulfide isomerase
MKITTTAAAVLLAAGAAACSRSPSPEELERTIAEHPQILYKAIEKHPAEFLEVLNRAAIAAQRAQAEQAQAAQNHARDEEFRNPKLPSIAQGRAIRGSPRAPVTIVEYSDFQCPYCRQEHEVLARVVARYDGRVRLVLKQTPLDIHPQALPAAQMFEALALQGSDVAWRFHDQMFGDQDRLQREGPAFILEAARRAGGDVTRAVQDARGPQVAATISSDQREARTFGFTGTPSLLVNGVSFDGAYPEEDIARVIDRHLAALGR